MLWTVVTCYVTNQQEITLDCTAWGERLGNDDKNGLMNKSSYEISNVRNESGGGQAHKWFIRQIHLVRPCAYNKFRKYFVIVDEEAHNLFSSKKSCECHVDGTILW